MPKIYFRYQSIRGIHHNDVVCCSTVLHCSRARYLCLQSPAHRAAIALVRAMQKPSRNDTHLRIAPLDATRPVSQALSTLLWLSMIETRNQLDMFSEKGTANAPSAPRLPI
jgi:hypothetical protein